MGSDRRRARLSRQKISGDSRPYPNLIENLVENLVDLPSDEVLDLPVMPAAHPLQVGKALDKGGEEQRGH